jgi:hypothetical protein
MIESSEVSGFAQTKNPTHEHTTSWEELERLWLVFLGSVVLKLSHQFPDQSSGGPRAQASF